MLKPLCYREHRRMSQVLWRTQEAYDKKRQCGLVPRTLTAHELIPLIQFLFLLKDSFVPHDNKTICSFPTCFLYKARRKTFFPEVESKVPSVLQIRLFPKELQVSSKIRANNSIWIQQAALVNVLCMPKRILIIPEVCFVHTFMRERLALTNLLMVLVSDLHGVTFLVLVIKFTHFLLNFLHLVFLQRSDDNCSSEKRALQ